MNRIIFGDNLPILRKFQSESIDLIYIDPPFNTGKTQQRTTIKTIRSENGDRKGFQGNIYQTLKLGTTSYKDSFNNIPDGLVPLNTKEAYDLIEPEVSLFFLEGFLRPRLIEAKRILKPNGSLYFHIDYREVHYCKILLDNIFGRENFINEIIWAYDFGGRAKSKWPAKHDNILFYTKDKTNYIFNTNEIDREPYMAPGLVGPEKVDKKKLPTDTWFFPYVGKRNTDTWWNTIVPTNGKERIGYPTQKPRKLMDRIVRASSYPGNVVMDFFAGSGTIGESCIQLNREFILIDNNLASMEVMAKRFSNIKGIHWEGFDPTPYQASEPPNLDERSIDHQESKFSKDFVLLASTASFLQEHLDDTSDRWKDSPFEWVLQLPPRKKGVLGRKLFSSWCFNNGIKVSPGGDLSESLIHNNHRYALKFSTLWESGVYQFQQIKSNGYDYLICFGISPTDAHCWIFPKELALKNAKPQHKGATGAEYWLPIDPKNIPDWARDFGGTLDKVLLLLKSVKNI